MLQKGSLKEQIIILTGNKREKKFIFQVCIPIIIYEVQKMNFSQITKSLEELSNIGSNSQKIEWLKNHNDEDLKNIFKWYFDS